MELQNVEWTRIADAGLDIATSDRGDDSIFEAFFAGYDRAFILPNEKEDAEGFRACLALNQGGERARLEAEYGRFRELCLGLLVPRDREESSALIVQAQRLPSVSHPWQQ